MSESTRLVNADVVGGFNAVPDHLDLLTEHEVRRLRRLLEIELTISQSDDPPDGDELLWSKLNVALGMPPEGPEDAS